MDKNSNFAIIFQFCLYLRIYEQKQAKFAKRKKIVSQEERRNENFWLFLTIFVQILTFFGHKCLNISNIEKLCRNLNFCTFCAHFDGFMKNNEFFPIFDQFGW